MVVCVAKSGKRVPGSGRCVPHHNRGASRSFRSKQHGTQRIIGALLANHIGELEVIAAAIKVARQQLKT
jgi:hypothetical protein